MKGVAFAITAVVLIVSLASGSPPLDEVVQYEQYCDDQKVSGSGTIDISTSMTDERIALEYANSMAGDGAFELESEQTFSDSAQKNVQEGSNVNLFESSKFTYKGLIPLTGEKYLRSKAFYGGIGAIAREAFSVNEMEGERKSYLGSTVTATSAHLLGFDTKGSFNGTFSTDSTWHKIFSKDIKSHQGFSGQFELDRQVKFHEKATYPSRIELEAVPCSLTASAGESITCAYLVKNAAESEVSGLALAGESLEAANLNRTLLGPRETAFGTATYTVTEEDILAGPKMINATVFGTDNMGEGVFATAGVLLVPDAVYYPGGTVTTSNDSGWAVYPDAFDLTGAGITCYLLDVNMAQSRSPLPACPYVGWPDPSASAMVQFGMTNSSPLTGVDPRSSVWQSLSLDPGFYLGGMAYRGGEGNASPSLTMAWSTPYAGTDPNGGLACPGDSEYDLFDLKMVLVDLGPGAGLRASCYQRVHRSTEVVEPALEWRLIGSLDVPEAALDKSDLSPFVLVGIERGPGGTVSWSRLIAAR